MPENDVYLYHAAIVENKLGFGKRLVFWLSGCNLNCPNCIAEEFNKLENGYKFNTKDFIDAFFTNFKYDGITFSGGEPLQQKKALLDIVENIDKSIDKMLFTGYEFSELDDIQKKVVSYFDLVIFGRYNYKLHGNYLWRGSKNQYFVSPTSKYTEKQLNEMLQQKSAGIDILLKNNTFWIYGIPTKEEFEILKNKLANYHIHIETNI